MTHTLFQPLYGVCVCGGGEQNKSLRRLYLKVTEFCGSSWNTEEVGDQMHVDRCSVPK